MITTITFDADETPWQFAAAQQRAFAHVLPAIRALTPSAKGMDVAELARWHRDFTTESDSARPWKERRLDAFRLTLRRLGRDDESTARSLTDAYMRVRYGSIELFDDVRPAFRALQRRYTLGLISNGNTRAARCGLAGVFNFELYAEDHDGARKPDRRMFDAALAHTGEPAGTLAHVGDSLTQDVAGALAVGAVAVWLNRTRESGRVDVAPTREISSLTDLGPALDALALAAPQRTP